MSKPKTKVPPHVFAANLEIPPDRDGRQVCRCGLIGEPGDSHHTMPEPAPDAQSRAAGDN